MPDFDTAHLQVLCQELRCLRHRRLVEEGAPEIDPVYPPQIDNLGDAVDVVHVMVAGDDGVQTPDPDVVHERCDDPRPDVLIIQRAGVEEEVGCAGQLRQDGLAVPCVETGETEVVAVGPLPFQEAQGDDYRQCQCGTQTPLEDGPAQMGERGEQDQSIVQDNQRQRHVADLDIGEVGPGHDLDRPDQQLGKEVQDVAQKHARGGQEEGNDDLHEAQDGDGRHGRRGQGRPDTR